MVFEEGAEVIPFVGSILNFDLTQAIGTYNLAGGAARFNKTISVVNTLGAELGTLTLDDPLVVGDIGFVRA